MHENNLEYFAVNDKFCVVQVWFNYKLHEARWLDLASFFRALCCILKKVDLIYCMQQEVSRDF